MDATIKWLLRQVGPIPRASLCVSLYGGEVPSQVSFCFWMGDPCRPKASEAPPTPLRWRKARTSYLLGGRNKRPPGNTLAGGRVPIDTMLGTTEWGSCKTTVLQTRNQFWSLADQLITQWSWWLELLLPWGQNRDWAKSTNKQRTLFTVFITTLGSVRPSIGRSEPDIRTHSFGCTIGLPTTFCTPAKNSSI